MRILLIIAIVLMGCLFIPGSAYTQSRTDGLEAGIRLYKEKDPIASLTQLLVYVHSKDATPEGLPKAYYYMGKLFEDSRLPSKALHYLLKADSVARADHPLKKAITGKIGDQYLAVKNYEKARTYYQRELALPPVSLEKNIGVYQQISSSFQRGQTRDNDSVLHYNKIILKQSEKLKQPEWQVKAHNNLGYSYNFIRKYDRAIPHFEKAVQISKDSKDAGLTGNIMLNLAIAYNNRGQQSKAIRRLKEARTYLGTSKNPADLAYYYNLMGGFYFRIQDLYYAEIYNDSAILFATEEQDPASLMEAYELTASIKNHYSDYQKENTYRRIAGQIRDSLQATRRQDEKLALVQAFNLERQEKQTIIGIQDARISEERADKAEKEKLLALEQAKRAEQEKVVATQQADLFLRDKELALERVKIAEQDKELFASRILVQRESRKKDSINLQLERKEHLAERLQKDKELEHARAEQAVQVAELEKSRLEKLVGFAVLLVLLLILVLLTLLYVRRTNQKLKESNIEIQANRKQIAEEKAKSDQLLLNILPNTIAEELKTQGTATPQHYDSVTVLFADIKGFTLIAEKMTPKELVSELDQYFKNFDAIIEKHNLEKIKTIGDAYMCAGGIPEPNDTNAIDMVAAAKEMIAYVQNVRKAHEKENKPTWDLRIGVHTGPVVAGVVGKNKFAYDIWGDAVNTASRMESSGQAGRINISEATYELVKDQFECTFRGQIEAKNKGKVAMYFVEE